MTLVKTIRPFEGEGANAKLPLVVPLVVESSVPEAVGYVVLVESGVM
jgi:hypothetical protein